MLCAVVLSRTEHFYIMCDDYFLFFTFIKTYLTDFIVPTYQAHLSKHDNKMCSLFFYIWEKCVAEIGLSLTCIQLLNLRILRWKGRAKKAREKSINHLFYLYHTMFLFVLSFGHAFFFFLFLLLLSVKKQHISF